MSVEEIYLGDSLEEIRKKGDLAKTLKDYYANIQKDAIIIELGKYIETIVEKYPEIGFKLTIEQSGEDVYYWAELDYVANIIDQDKEKLEDEITKEVCNICKDQELLKEIRDIHNQGEIKIEESDKNIYVKIASIFYGKKANEWMIEKTASQLHKYLDSKLPLIKDKKQLKI